jgi:hypothetical protein
MRTLSCIEAMRCFLAATVCLMMTMCRVPSAGAATLPPDIRPGYWAAKPVQQILQNGVLTLQSDGKFHGDAKVTRTQAVIALARLGRILEQGQWKDGAASRAVPSSVTSLWEKTDWKHQALRRYTLAAILARFAEYVTNGLPRPKPGSKTGQSETLQTAQVTAARTHPAYDSLVYLAHNRMIQPGSPLLKPDNNPITGGEMSRALAEFAAGLNDRLTDLGKSPDSSTPDETDHKPKPR